MKKQSETPVIYGTGNPAKLLGMKRWLADMPITMIGLKEAAEMFKKELPIVEESGTSPLENARLKAKAYYECFQMPVFSCDSGLYLWNYETGQMLPKELQPGICVRGRSEKRYTDEELIAHYTGLVKKYGPIMARYQNAVSMIVSKEQCFESADESLWGDAFLFTDVPHSKIVPGFPLDSISLEIKTGKYFYDMEGDSQDVVAAQRGFQKFFEKVINSAFLRDE